MSQLVPASAVVAALLIAAAVPLATASLFVEPTTTPALAAPAAALARSVVVVTTARPADATSGAVNGAPRGSGQPPAAPGDDRWWRDQIGRIATTSVMRWPDSPAVAAQSVAGPAAVPLVPGIPASHIDALPNAPSSVPPVARFSGQRLGPAVPTSIKRWEPLILRYSRVHNLDPNLVAALMNTESGGDPGAVSPMNAIGLMQVLNGPADPAENIDQGAAILAKNLKQFRAIELALAAYNAGPAAVASNNNSIPPYAETYQHVSRTLSSYAAFRAI